MSLLLSGVAVRKMCPIMRSAYRIWMRDISIDFRGRHTFALRMRIFSGTSFSFRTLSQTSRSTVVTSKRVPRHDASIIYYGCHELSQIGRGMKKHTLPVMSSSKAFNSSSGISPFACNRSISCKMSSWERYNAYMYTLTCMICCTPTLKIEARESEKEAKA